MTVRPLVFANGTLTMTGEHRALVILKCNKVIEQ